VPPDHGNLTEGSRSRTQPRSETPCQLARAIDTVGPFAIAMRAPATLNALFSRTKIQFLHADEVAPQRLLAQPIEVAGLRVLDDLLAIKLNVVGDRGELRDYFDLMTIEQRAGRSVEEGLQLFLARFQPPYPQQALGHIVPNQNRRCPHYAGTRPVAQREPVIRLTTDSTAERSPGTNASDCIVQQACPASTVTVCASGIWRATHR
jgi:hypothetical protein